MGIIDFLYLLFAGISIYFIFLFFLLFFSKRKVLRELPSLKRLPSISIIIPAHNEEKAIANTIKAVKKLTYNKNLLEIIVVDDGSTDRTAEIAKSFKNVKVISKKRGGKASALNLGLKYARGEIVACVDADSYPKKNGLMNSVPFFSEKDVGAVTSSIFVKNPKNFIEIMQKFEYIMIVWSRKLLEYLDAVYVTPGPMSLYRKKILLKLGGFDEKNLTEDIEIAWRFMRHGYKIKMALDSEVYTTAPSKFRSWWHQRLRWNVGGMQTVVKYAYTFFRSGFKSLGFFVLPFFTLSYILSLLGFGVFLFVFGRGFFNFFSFTLQAYAIGINPVNYYSVLDYLMLPNIFMIFGIAVFGLSLVWAHISFKSTRKYLTGPKDYIYLLVYMAFYITIFPFILIQSTWRFLTKKREW